MSEELLEILEPIIEQKMVLREQKGLEQGLERGLEKGIKGTIDILRDIGRKDAEIKTIIMKKYELTEKNADAYLQAASHIQNT